MQINPRLNPNAQKWVKALLSGKYHQGRAQLCSENRFCCLGVACELAIADGVNIQRNEENNCILYDDKEASLPDSVVTWLGLKSDVSSEGRFDVIPETLQFVYTVKNDHYHLSLLNDDAHYTFEELAAIINTMPKGLFKDEDKQDIK